MRHLVGSSLLSGLAAGLLLGCSLSTVGAMDPAEGGKCDVPMQAKTASDGCTACVCNGKTWDCSSDACMGGCSAGDTKTADDGCNSCACGMDGKWSCTTDQTCTTAPTPMPECQPGDTKLRDDGCYRCGCDMSGNWDCPDTACITCTPGESTLTSCLSCTCNALGNNWTCSGAFDGPPCTASQMCKPGETKAGTTECITCTCSDDGTEWNCVPATDKGCPATTCMPGETTPSSDGCNTCTCTTDGKLACTTKYCDPCPAPRTGGGMCSQKQVFAQDPETKTCCSYASQCEAPDGWTLYPTAECSSATTTPPMCSASMADCDAEPADGCETNIMTSPLNCGACGNVCVSAQGPAICDQGKCVTPAAPVCLYGGVTYTPGEMFPARDGCNYCACTVDKDSKPSLICSGNACKCDPSTETYRNYAVTDATQCPTVDFMCPENTTLFANDCGCGCEQSTDCPNVFDCTPDPMTMKSSCDMALVARCPYSIQSK